MVMTNRGNDVPEPRHRRHEIRTIGRVILNNRPFLRSQLVLLRQDRSVLFVNLSYIVKKRRPADFLNLAVCKTEGSSNDLGNIAVLDENDQTCKRRGLRATAP